MKLVINNDWLIISSINTTQLFVYRKQLYINTINFSQQYTNVPFTHIENCNVYILFEQINKTIQCFIYMEVNDKFGLIQKLVTFIN